MSIEFHIEAESGSGRAGRLATPHGDVRTPVFMPVGTLASVKGVPQDILEELGVQILLGNTYHLYLRPGVEQIRKLGGLHRFMSWSRAILTDSGGFQVFSLSELRKLTEEGVTFRSHLDGSSHFFTPESAMDAQIGLGADIIMAFDECTEYPAEEQRVRDSMELTLRWAQRSKKYFEEHKHGVPWSEYLVPGSQNPEKPQDHEMLRSSHSPDVPPVQTCHSEERSDEESALSEITSRSAGPSDIAQGRRPESAVPAYSGNHSVELGSSGQTGTSAPTRVEATQALFGIVQGGMDLQLRKESAERTIEIGFPGYAIGGLSVGEPRHVTREVVEATLEYLPKDKPRYLMGVGTPEEIADYARLGIDMMDCVLPTRAARHGLLFTSEGKVSIKQARYAGDQGPLDPNCSCRVCNRYSRAYLRHLYASNEVLAQILNTVHNLSYYLDTMRSVRDAILLGDRASFLSGGRSAPKS